MSLSSASSSRGSESECEQEIVVKSHSRILISPRKSRRDRSDKRRSTSSHRVGSSQRHRVKEASGQFKESKRNADAGLAHESESRWGPPQQTRNEAQRNPPHPKTPSISDNDSEKTDSERKTTRISKTRVRENPHAASRPILKKNEFASGLNKESSGSLEDLKRTLNNLVHQSDRAHSFTESEYIRAMPVLETLGTTPPVEQLRLAEYLHGPTRTASKKPFRHTSLQSIHSSSRWGDTQPRKSKSIAFGDQQYSHLPSPHTAPPNQPSLNKKLFSDHIPATSGYEPSKPALSFTVGTDASMSGGAQGSRALLSALKALQDKIRRLEEERESLMQELSDAKVKVRKQEAELAANEKKTSYELMQTKESARGAYEAIRGEREELKLDLAQADEQRKAMMSEIEHFRALAHTFSKKADDLSTQLQISEKQRTRLEMEMQKMKHDNEQAIDSLSKELERTQELFNDAQGRLESTSTELERESASHKNMRERLRESEQTVAALSQLNEKLVGKIWEATDAANTATKKSKKLQAQQRVSTLTRPTAASAANSAAISGPSVRRSTETNRSNGEASISLKRVSKRSESTTGPSKSKKKLAKSSKTTAKASTTLDSANRDNMTRLREANMGKEIPFLVGSHTNRSFSVIGHVQDAIRQCDTTYVAPSLIESTTATPTAIGSRKSTNYEDAIPSRICISVETGEEKEYLRGSGKSATPRSTRSRTKGPAFKRNKPDAIKVPSANPYMSPMQTQIMEDLGEAIESAEKEFHELNHRYKEIVSEIETSRDERSSASDGDETRYRGSSAQLSEALGPLLDDLEAKGKQLNLLKQVYEQASRSTINPMRRVVLSPEAVRRKTASLRVLNEYRQMEREARGGSLTSPRVRSRWS